MACIKMLYLGAAATVQMFALLGYLTYKVLTEPTCGPRNR